MTFIFVHIPKTAGTSFRKAAKAHFNCLWDYGLESPETSKLIKEVVYGESPDRISSHIEKENIDFISGHFSAQKYKKNLPGSKFITFVRDPVDRLISEYNHHVRHGGYQHSIEIYCQNPGHHNRQSHFLSELPISDFYFIGVTEQYSLSLKIFNRLSHLSFKEIVTNRAQDHFRSEREIYRKDMGSDLIAYIKSNNKRDYILYEKSISQLKDLMVQYNL